MNELTPYKGEISKKSGPDLKAMFSNILTNENLLPILLIGLLTKSGQISGSTDDIARSSEMLKMAKPYFKETHKDALSKTENILDALYSINKLTKGEYRGDESYRKSYDDVQDKPIKILQAVRPHMKGRSRDTIEKVLTVEDRIKRLKDKNKEKNILEDFESMTDILEVLQKDKGSEVRNVITKAKQMINIMRQ